MNRHGLRLALVRASKPAGNGRRGAGGGNVAPIVPGKPRTRRSADGPCLGRQLHLLIIDSRRLTRDCLVAAIQTAPDIAPIVAIGSVDEVRRHIDGGAVFDAVIVNLGAERLDAGGIGDRVAPIRSAMPGSAIVLLNTSTESVHVTAAFRQGVRGYLTTATSPEVTIDAIRFVCAGWIIYPPFDFPVLAPPQSDQIQLSAALAAKLTLRQEQVLGYLATGMQNKAIASHLGMTERTVKAHVKEIMQRVGAVNRTQVVAFLGRRPTEVP